MRDKYQGGSLGGYVVVAIVLALALIGGLYGLQRYNASRENQDNTEVAREERSDEKREGSEESRETPRDEGEDRDDASSDTPRNDDEEGEEVAPDDAATGSTADEEDELPQTGPAETVVTAAALGALAFAGTSFVRSRSWTSRRD